jgi:Ni/Co efflux regulator RcnB
MRVLLIAMAGVSGLSGAGLADAASAQQRVAVRGPGATYPVPGAPPQAAPPPVVQTPAKPPATHGHSAHGHAAPMHVAPPLRPQTSAASRWGSKVDGRWWGGVNAPGGYAAYRRPTRGFVLPPYWADPRFTVTEWQAYDLPQPPVGYNWVRYYDDAVLVDANGAVFDVQPSVDWDRIDAAPYQNQIAGAPYAYPAAPAPYAEPRRDSGLGGAAIGAVAGGALGALVAGRGDGLGGALIGAGVGAATGYLVDKNEDRGRAVAPPPPAYGATYGAPYAAQTYSSDAYPYAGYQPAPTTQTFTVPAGGTHTVFVGPGVTTVTVSTQPTSTTTTTTTEYVDDVVTYSRPTHRAPTKRVYRSKRLRR